MDPVAVERLQTHIEGLLRTGVRYLLVDVSRAHHFDPATLAPMLECVARQLRERGGFLATEGAELVLSEDLTSVSLVELFTLYQRLRPGAACETQLPA